MSNRYWGELPAPNITRGNSLKVHEEDEKRVKGNRDLSVDTHMAGGRSPGPIHPDRAQPRQDRYSSQTDKTEAPTMSTQSPFVSPIASEFRGDGLAPRPSSYQAGAPNTAYNKEFSERRKRRESRNRENYEPSSPIPPPTAPDPPRAPPPVSYKAPYSNGPSSQSVSRSGSGRRSEGPVSPIGPSEDYYRRDLGQEYHPGDEEKFQARRLEPRNGKNTVRHAVNERSGVTRTESNTSQPRKGSIPEWTHDRSPLQRLELTLDSITKEEKRARVEEAELQIRDERAVRSSQRATQNSVRFRNRPIAKAPEPGTQPASQSLAEASVVRNPSTKQKDQLQKSVMRESLVSNQYSSPSKPRDLVYQAEPNQSEPPLNNGTAIPLQRGSSLKDNSKIPITVTGATTAAGGVRRESNKLRKKPPTAQVPAGVPWFPKLVASENRHADVQPERYPSVKGQQQPASVANTAKETAFRSHHQASIDKELPRLPQDFGDEDEMRAVAKPVRRGSISKVEQLTGDRNVIRSLSGKQPNAQSPKVTVNGTPYAVNASPRAVESPMVPENSRKEHHHLTDVLNHFHHPNVNRDGVYVPSPRLDEWKKGGVALLSGALLDLNVQSNQSEQAEKDKDKAWWEAGNTGVRRRSSTSAPRKAEAYDGEYDDTNSMLPLPSLAPIQSIECEGCVSERQACEIARSMRFPHNLALEMMNKNNVHPNFETAQQTPMLDHTLKPHSLTCLMRGVRICPNIAPTRFKPPLFMKSGPMLRYCGLRREKVKSRSGRKAVVPDREIWRGSIMVVTQDAHSSYELAPTLRLFLQPVNLLPPPPAQLDGDVDELAPEYIDPIAGLPKIGRDGRTLYIRPVDYLEEAKDLSREESDDGLFESQRTPLDGANERRSTCPKPHYDGERAGKYKEVRGFRLHAEQGVTFWRFNIEVELRENQQRIAYRINRGPATPFWVPARDQAMNIMFHSCNGFSHGVDPDQFCGPDPMWRDVLNTHQTQPYHVMLGGGDQLYNDIVMDEAKLFREWSDIKDPFHKERCPWTTEMQQELEKFYLDRYCMWFSQGLFGVAVSQIPMINIFDDHDIIDGFGSYSTKYMESPVFSGLGEVAFKYYMLFQHQSSIDEGEETEPSWILGTQPGPYIKELSRSVFLNLGRSIAFLGLDCRTERMNDEIVSAETYHKVFDRLSNDIVKGETKHLIVLVGVPVAYPRMVWLENILTSRAMEPIKYLSRAGLLGKKLLNHMDGGVEILDDLDDHWTAKHHKDERNWFVQELQDLAAEKSVRVTILSGDVHLAAIGQFYSNPKLGIAKDHDFRYMPNIISSAIVNTPPPDTLADILNKRNKVHHLDAETDEDMIPIFTHDVNGKPRNNKRLLNRRNWCSIRQYNPDLSPPPTPQTDGPPSPPPAKIGLLRRLSGSRGPSYRPDVHARRGPTDAPPLSSPGFFAQQGAAQGAVPRRGSMDSQKSGFLTRTISLKGKNIIPSGLFRRNSKRHDSGGINGYGEDTDSGEEEERRYNNSAPGLRGGSGDNEDGNNSYFPIMPPATGRQSERPVEQAPTSLAGQMPQQGLARSKFHRTPTGLSEKQLRQNLVQDINLEGGLDICLNVEINQKDPTGATTPYRLLVPALWYDESQDRLMEPKQTHIGMKRWKTLKKNKGKGKDDEDYE